jgi:cob(I)alamin adenosyltransferase
MVRLNRIYTRTGDDGTTGLGSGERRVKYDLRIAAYGTVDETNAAVGTVRLYTSLGATPEDARVDIMLGLIQNDLFDLGADLCVPDDPEPRSYEPLRMVDAQVDRLEQDIDALNESLPALKSFILPGGTPAAAHLHLARTIARRAERLIVELAQTEPKKVGAPAIKYINRLSDFLFVASRFVNSQDKGDVLWIPGKNR